MEAGVIMKNLFLTGPIGSGKSTSIATALGEYLPKAGGFLTVRQLDSSGRAVAYWMQRPNGSDGQIIIDYSAKPYTMHLEVFESLGVELLDKAQAFDFVVLDEIGGFEVLSDVFMEALIKLLQSDTPCIGVMKGVAPASKMIQKLGLGDTYVQKAEQLRSWMRHSENTLLYECTQFDPEGLRLAREWANQYCK
jgi:nucleoside-triphosphatase THEP1